LHQSSQHRNIFSRAVYLKTYVRGLSMSTAAAPTHEMLRPSRIYVQATHSEGGAKKVRVAGRTIPIASGRIFLP
jgi:predicted PhzF superfamily epimerase YddE/YHI9